MHTHFHRTNRSEQNDRSDQKAHGGSSSGVLERAAIREPHITSTKTSTIKEIRHTLANTNRNIQCRTTEDANKCYSRRCSQRTVDEDEDSRHRDSEYVTRGRDMKRENTHAP